MSTKDPTRELQAAAARAAEHLAHQHGYWVVVLDAMEVPLVRLPVPPGIGGKGSRDEPGEAPAPGWVVTERGATFDGTPVSVPATRLKLLRVLVEAEGKLTNKELTALAFDSYTDEANTRYHVRELKKELAKAFTFDGDVIQGDNDGYRLVLR